jgi:hypothetical protein
MCTAAFTSHSSLMANSKQETSVQTVASCGHACIRRCAGSQLAPGSQLHVCAGWGLPPPSEQTPTPRRGGRGRGRRGGRARGGRGMKGRGRGWRRGGGRGDDFDSVSVAIFDPADSGRHKIKVRWQQPGPDADAVWSLLPSCS